MSQNPRKDALEALVKLHIDSTYFNDPKVVEKAAQLFVFLSDRYIRKASGETFYSVPYREITIYIFEHDCKFNTEEFLSFTDTVHEKMKELSDYIEHPYSEYLFECYSKFTLHISLAEVQKREISKVTNKAYKIANDAKKIANEADAQAKSTIANYISILGIFASIIFTLFGGVNLIGSTVKLLEVNSRWPYLTFIISLLMICLLTLLNMLVKWINSMSNLKRVLENQNRNDGFTIGKISVWKPWTWDFYSKSVSSFLVILIISLVGMYNVNKENLFTVTNETTTKIVAATPPSVESNNKKPSETVETTEVKKLTVTNKIKEDAREENKEEKTEN